MGVTAVSVFGPGVARCLEFDVRGVPPALLDRCGASPQGNGAAPPELGNGGGRGNASFPGAIGEHGVLQLRQEPDPAGAFLAASIEQLDRRSASSQSESGEIDGHASDSIGFPRDFSFGGGGGDSPDTRK